MIIKKADNVYRSIGGRANPGGVERINRDGKMEILSLGHEEITPKERMNWNAKAKLDPRGRLPEDFYKVESNDAGNSMAVDDETRTRLPRKHQYSTEARLSEDRGEKAVFHKSTATSAQAHGVTDGMVADNTFVDPGKYEGDIGAEDRSGKKNKAPEKPEKRKVDASSYKLADAFVKVAETLSQKEFLDSKTVAAISNTSEVSVEDVLSLEKVAQGNIPLATKYRMIKKKCPSCHPKSGIPGTVNPDSEDPDELEKRSLQETAVEVGLSD